MCDWDACVIGTLHDWHMYVVGTCEVGTIVGWDMCDHLSVFDEILSTQ